MAQVTNAELLLGSAGAYFLSVPYCEVTSFKRTPVMGEDGRTMVGLRSEIECRGMFASADAYEDFRATYAAARGTDVPVGYRLRFRLPGGSWETLSEYENEAPDDLGGPFFNINATEVVGISCVMVSFSIVSQSSAPYDGGDPVPAVAHTWRQTVRHDENGRLIRMVNGLLTCAPSMYDGIQVETPAEDSSAAEWKPRAPYPDLFRLAIVPDVPGPGWRRLPGEYALTAEGNALAYQFTDEQNLHDLPYPAMAGNFEFEYERTLEDAGAANLVASVELSAGMNINVRELVAAAFDLIAARITPGRDLILRMTVRERAIMTGPSIAVEIEAKTYSNNLANNAALPLAVMIGQPFSVVREDCSRTVPPYGVPGFAWWMEPHWVSNSLTAQTSQADAMAMPQAVMYQFSTTACPDAASVIVTPGDTWVSEMNQTLDGPYPAQYPKVTDVSGDWPATFLLGYAETRMVVNPGIGRLSSAYLTGPDFVYQFEKPYSKIVEKTTVSAMNQNIAKPMRPMPPNTILVSESWNVTPGQGDPQGMRSYIGVFMRELATFDGGGTTSGGYANATYGSRTYRIWSPPNETVAGALTPVLDGDTQESANSVLAAFTDGRLVSDGTTSPGVMT